MSRFIVRADSVVTMNNTSQLIADGAVIVDGSRIEAVVQALSTARVGPSTSSLVAMDLCSCRG